MKKLYINNINFKVEESNFKEEMRFSSWVDKNYVMPSILIKISKRDKDNNGVFKILVLDPFKKITKKLIGKKLYFGTHIKELGSGFIKEIEEN